VAEHLGIRRARVEDAATIHRLLQDLAATLGKSEDIHSRVEDIERFGFGREPCFEAMLACAVDGSRERPVGLVVYFYEFSTWRGHPGVYVQDLYVAPEMRGRGLGRELVQAVRERAAEWGGRYIKLTVYDRNPAALAFYHGLGFESCEDELPLVWREPGASSEQEDKPL
jgi:GNAT superfamily N-acetyltransferase